MKIFELQLRSPKGDVVFVGLVPEVHIQEKISQLFNEFEVQSMGAICFKEIGDIFDGYIKVYHLPVKAGLPKSAS